MKKTGGSRTAQSVDAALAAKPIHIKAETRPTSRGAVRLLTSAVILLVGACLGLVILLVQGGAKGASPGADATAKAATASKETSSTPWGKLEILPMSIAPPLEMVPEYAPVSESTVEWNFPNSTTLDLSRQLTEMGLPETMIPKLMAMAKINPRINGQTIQPPREFVLGMKSDDRAKLYFALGASMENPDQVKAFRFCGDNPEEWLKRATLPKSVKDLVTPLIYKRNGFMFFADLRSVEPSLPSPEDRLQLVKAFSHEATYTVLLNVTPESDIESLVSYWGRGGYEKDVRPRIEAAASREGGGKCDIVFLLPPFARQRLYKYPVPAESLDTVNQDCHWSALNFFASDKPDNRYSIDKEVAKAIETDYYRVYGKFQLGDLVLFFDEQHNLYHSASYVANDILFTKNGNLSQRPWMFMKLSDMKNFYPMPKPPDVRFYRRKGI
jgi:hypothetical protein